MVDLCNECEVSDGWRIKHQETDTYTYYQAASGSRSRIDRIYVTDDILSTATDWRIDRAGRVNTDHLLVSVKITSPEMPFIGPGRWPMPMNLLKDVEMTKYMHERGKKLEEDI